MLAPDTVLQSRYRIVCQLGQGGMGAVYEAIDERLNSVVAIKETFAVNDDGVRAFRKEAQLLANLSHHALPKVIDYFVEGNGQFLVMEFISGQDYKQILAGRKTPFSFNELKLLIDKVSEALEYLHSCNPPVIHRDIKPANIKLTQDGKVYLLDFGLAKGVAGQMSTVQTSSLHGYTLSYAPPEQIQNRGTDARSDIYALGATLYHLLTNTLPPDAITRLSEIALGKPDILIPANQISTGLSQEVTAALTRAMALEPEKRPAYIGELVSAVFTNQSEKTQLRPKVKIPSQLSSREGGAICSLAFSHDGKYLASGKYLGLIEVWEVSAGNLVHSLEGHSDLVLSLAFSPSNNKIASVGADGSMILWNVKTESVIWQQKSRLKWLGSFQSILGVGIVYSVVFSDNGKMLASGYSGGIIKLWDVQTGRLLNTIKLPAHVGNITALDFGYKTLVVGSSAGYICAAEIETGKLVWHKEGHKKCIKYIHHNYDGILSGGMDSAIKWAVNDEMKEAVFEQAWGQNREDVNCIAFTRSRDFMATGTDDGIVHFCNIQHSYEVCDKAGEYEEKITSVALSPDGKIIAAGSMEKFSPIWLIETEHLKCRSYKPLKLDKV